MRSNRRTKNVLTWGYLETLESRNLLSASPLSTAALASETAPAVVGPVAPAGVLLAAQLTSISGTTTASVQFAQNSGAGGANSCFCIEVQGAPANDTLSVTLGGATIGTITTNAQGVGELALATNPQGPQLALPANFPTRVQSGTAVGVTDSSSAVSLSGALATVAASTNPTGKPPAAAVDATMLGAQLTAAGSTTTASFQFTQATADGTTYTVLAVRVYGAPAGDPLSVTVDGVVVGQINSSANGTGGLTLSSNPQGQQQALPANFPTGIAAGTAVSVTDASSLSLSGTLAAPPPAPAGSLLTAQLTGTGTTATGSIQLEQYTANAATSVLLAVQVQGAPATDTLTVTLGGVAVGQITTDANGNGALVLSSNPQGSQQPLPANFPTSVAAGAAVSITDATSLSLTGSLSAPAKPVGPAPPPPPPAAAAPSVMTLVGKLTGTGTTATASAQFTQDNVNGSSYTSFSVQVQGAPANDTLSVSLGGVAIGQITTDANGNGQLSLSSNPQGQQQPLPVNFPTKGVNGAAVSVTDASSLDLTGKLAPPSPAPIGSLLAAQLTGAGTTATATAQLVQCNVNGVATTVFSVQVQGAPANDTLTVTLGGVSVGQITTDGNGNGVLALSSNSQGQQQPLPANFPSSVVSGATISITDASSLSLTGTLTTPPKATGPVPPPPPPPPPTSGSPTSGSTSSGTQATIGTMLSAQLTGTGTTATASVQFTQDTINGTAFTLLCVQVHGAPANDTLSVTLGGVIVGQITTDAKGNGTLALSSNPQGQQQPLPANFPASVASGAAVSVTDASALNLSGTLATPTPAAIGTLLTTQLTGTGTTATGGVQLAQFTVNGTATTVFAVQVQGAPASESITVTLAGVEVGTLTTDDDGNGTLVLSSNPQGQQLALPVNFPTDVASGAVISLTDSGTLDITGTLATPPKPTQPAPAPPAPVANGTVLSAQLTGAGTAATVSVQFTQDTVNGTTYTTLCVQVTGAPANDTLSVTVGGVVVGTLTTGANGSGTLGLSSNPEGKQQTLPANFPTSVASGTTVAVADANSLSLTGTLAVATAPPPTPWHNSSNPLDVIGGGGAIVPMDALLIINYLNTQGAGALPSEQPVGSYDLDVLGDNSVTPSDALAIINYLNLHPSGTGSNSDSPSDVTPAVAGVVTPQVVTGTTDAASTTSTSSTSGQTAAAANTGPTQLAVGAGLNTGSGGADCSPSAAITASTSQSSATMPSSTGQSTVGSAVAAPAVMILGATSGTGVGLNQASVDAALADPLFDF